MKCKEAVRRRVARASQVLDELARFDPLGLWSCRSVWFSAHGTLVDTVAALVDAATAGYFVDELDEALHVKTKDCLRQLAVRRRAGLNTYAGPSTAQNRTGGFPQGGE